VLVGHPDAGATTGEQAVPPRLAAVRPDRLRSAAPRTVVDRLGQKYLGMPAYGWAIGIAIGTGAAVVLMRNKD
jgi:hypothetical protein